MKLDRLACGQLQQIDLMFLYFINNKFQGIFGNPTAREAQTQHVAALFLCIASETAGDAFERIAVDLSGFKCTDIFFKYRKFQTELVNRFLVDHSYHPFVSMYFVGHCIQRQYMESIGKKQGVKKDFLLPKLRILRYTLRQVQITRTGFRRADKKGRKEIHIWTRRRQ